MNYLAPWSPDPGKLEYEYSPSQWSKRTYADYAPDFIRDSEREYESVKARVACVEYGKREREFFEWIPGSPLQPTFMWIHGGYWQGSSVSEARYGMSRLAALDWPIANLEYTLAPEVTIYDMVDECVLAIQEIRTRSNAKLIVGGHSAGAHLALMAAQRVRVEELLLVSGVFDLRPLAHMSLRDEVGLDESNAEKLSPILNAFSAPTPVRAKVLVGAEESQSFIDQSNAVAEYLTDLQVSVISKKAPGRDHFDVITLQNHIDFLLES